MTEWLVVGLITLVIVFGFLAWCLLFVAKLAELGRDIAFERELDRHRAEWELARRIQRAAEVAEQ